jgi:ketosteroid isomerase-like protein
MFTRNVLLALVAFALASTACQSPTQTIHPLSQEDVNAIKALGASVDESVLALDWDAFLALTTEDVIMMFPNSPAIQGGAAFRAWIGQLEVATSSEHKLEFLDIDGYGDIAYARGTYTEAYTLKDAAEPSEDNGKFLLILRKQSDGPWLISIWMHNSDLPLPSPGPELPSS